MLPLFAITFASLLALQPLAASATAVERVAPRDFPPGLTIPDDLYKWEFSYLGCFTNPGPIDALTMLYTSAGTIEGCLDHCTSQTGYYGLAYVGVQGGSACSCDWVLQDPAVKVDDSECNVPCLGNSSSPCGGQDRLTVVEYLFGSPTRAPLTIGNNEVYQGCYHDSQTAKVFPYRAIVDTRFFTLEVCALGCKTAGFQYAGIEFRNECWCGTEAQLATSSGIAPDTECGMACVYNYHERCGGPDRMSVYKLY